MSTEENKPGEEDIIRITDDDLESPAPAFRPAGRISIQRPPRQEVEPIENLIKHPFDDEKFQQFLEQEFPKLKSAVAEANRPKISEKPDDLETWEAQQILQRRKRFDVGTFKENDWSYLSRLLYEECFSVNQNPDKQLPPTKKGSSGFTTGGLISHFTFLGAINDNWDIESAVRLPFSGANFLEAFNSLSEYRQQQELLFIVFYCTEYGANPLGHGGMASVQGVERLLRKGVSLEEKGYGSIGFRLIELLRKKPEFFEEIKDQKLLEIINMTERSMSKLLFYIQIWKKFGKELIEDHGSYKNTEDEAVRESIKKLLFVRTHPEMQIFFEYLSPSGFLNEV